MEPVTLKRCQGALIVMKVAQHEVRRSVHDLAHLAHRHVLHQVIDHAGLHVENRFAARAGFAQLVFRAQHGGQRRDFGLAIQVP